MLDKKRSIANPFYLKNNRAMVSLGPFSEDRHCIYRCAFCYVQDEFISYANLDIEEIVAFLKDNRLEYNIIYVSGDTDSFAPPRTEKGLELLKQIATEINCDLLFTTRTKFVEKEYNKLQHIVSKQIAQGKTLYACVSISHMSEELSYLEPNPIPSPDERVCVLKHLKSIGATTVLAIRPFLPVVPLADYLEIIDKCKDYTDIVLGECFYFVRNGNVQKRLFPNGIIQGVERNIVRKQKMPFDDNLADWDIWDSVEYQNAIAERCKLYGIVFSMRSEEAIRLIENIKEGKNEKS